jgi:hypothetical protein
MFVNSLLDLPTIFAQASILSSANIVPVTIFLVLGGSWIVSALTLAWVKVRETSEHNDLKRLMIERGMSVDEIERVLAAGKSKLTLPTGKTEMSAPPKPQAGPMTWPAHSNS